MEDKKEGNFSDGGRRKAEEVLYRSSDLFRAKQEVLIEHEGEIYRLRITRNGKLIMNK